MIRKLMGLLFLGSIAACNAQDETASSSAAATEAPAGAREALDCDRPGAFAEDAMKGIGDATYVRADAAPANSLQRFTLGSLVDIPGWAGKNADYTRDVAAPCTDVAAIGDGSGLRENSPLPMTVSACAGQRGSATVMMDNPALGAFLSFEDASGLPFGKDVYFITGSQLDPNGKVAALCLSNAGTGDRFLVTRQ